MNSEEWNLIYSKNQQLSVWPWSDLISLVAKFTGNDLNGSAVLELGFGAGANIQFIKSLGAKYYGIDGSKIATDKALENHPELHDRIYCGDFTSDIAFDDFFDLVIDRCSLAHNSTAGIKSCIELLDKRMRKDSLFIGIDWYAIEHPAFLFDATEVDQFTKTSFKHGQFKNVGNTHFTNEASIKELFENFEIIHLIKKIIYKCGSKDNIESVTYNFVARKI